MKKIFLFSICFLTFLPVIYAQHFVGHIISFPLCQMMSYQYNINQAANNLSVKTFFGDGQDTTVYLGATQDHQHYYHNYASLGTYSTKTLLFNSGIAIDSFSDIVDVLCEYVVLSSYMDNDNDCNRQYPDTWTSGTTKIEVDSAGTIIDTVSFEARLEYKTTPNTIYHFREITPPTGRTNTCPSNNIITITTPPIGFAGYADFGHRCNSTSSQFDLSVDLFGMFRPVSTSRIQIMASNNACGTKNATITLNLSPKYKYNTATPTPASVSGQVITWNIDLADFDKYYLLVTLDTATLVNLGDTVCNSVTITPTSGDVDITNNAATTCSEVVAAWDPNDKIVFPSGDIAPGTQLTYTINFENMGGDTAFNIHVLDTLSDHVDPASLQVISSSHTMMKRYVDNNLSKTIVKFEFPDIHLADSNSKQYNKGFVKYSIRTKTGLPYGTEIKNRAGIYFDINPVVLTEYAYNRIPWPASIGEAYVANGLTVYPNPVTDILTIKDKDRNYLKFRLLNYVGYVITAKQLDGSITQIDLKKLQPGIYYLQVIGEKGAVYKKIEKL
jgi:uncharacterized repeat protein (TIGR01451 family)